MPTLLSLQAYFSTSTVRRTGLDKLRACVYAVNEATFPTVGSKSSDRQVWKMH